MTIDCYTFLPRPVPAWQPILMQVLTCSKRWTSRLKEARSEIKFLTENLEQGNGLHALSRFLTRNNFSSSFFCSYWLHESSNVTTAEQSISLSLCLPSRRPNLTYQITCFYVNNHDNNKDFKIADISNLRHALHIERKGRGQTTDRRLVLHSAVDWLIKAVFAASAPPVRIHRGGTLCIATIPHLKHGNCVVEKQTQLINVKGASITSAIRSV